VGNLLCEWRWGYTLSSQKIAHEMLSFNLLYDAFGDVKNIYHDPKRVLKGGLGVLPLDFLKKIRLWKLKSVGNLLEQHKYFRPPLNMFENKLCHPSLPRNINWASPNEV
jgi:hypothetical protein